jgi:hypothetical protein
VAWIEKTRIEQLDIEPVRRNGRCATLGFLVIEIFTEFG